MRRASSLLGIDSAIERELDDKYATIKEVADNISTYASKLDAISGVNTGDQDLSGYVTITSTTTIGEW